MVEVNDLAGPLPAGHFDYYPLRVGRIIRETADACSLVFNVPQQLRELFTYQAGQYLTLRAEVAGEQLERCYSLSSSPATDTDYRVTVKAIDGGRLSNWINRELREGDIVEVMPPNGRFCLRESPVDVLLFTAGSGITPGISLLKTALVAGEHKIRMLYANRDQHSTIFRGELAALQARYPERFELIENLDVDKGFVTAELVRSVAAGMKHADCFICGPGPYMDIVESTLLSDGFDRHQVFVERFLADADEMRQAESVVADSDGITEDVTIILAGKTHQLPYIAGDTVLECARRQGLRLPFSCRIGSCATCIAKVVDGGVRMKVNHVLTPEEVEEGFVLICQSIPASKRVTIKYQG